MDKRELALILLRADRAYTATNCDEACNGIKRLEKNGAFGNALDAEIDDTIHFEISPAQLRAKCDRNRNCSENYGGVS